MADAIPEADAREQQLPVDPKVADEDGRLKELERERLRRALDTGEAADADLLEQAETVAFDEEEQDDRASGR